MDSSRLYEYFNLDYEKWSKEKQTISIPFMNSTSTCLFLHIPLLLDVNTTTNGISYGSTKTFGSVVTHVQVPSLSSGYQYNFVFLSLKDYLQEKGEKWTYQELSDINRKPLLMLI